LAVVCLAAGALLFTNHIALRGTIERDSRAAAERAASKAAAGIDARLSLMSSAAPSPDRLRHIVFREVREHLATFPLEASYAFIVSETGNFISVPERLRGTRKHTLADVFPGLANAASIAALPSLPGPEGIRLLEDHLDKLSGRHAWTYFAPVGNRGWWAGIVLDKEEIYRQSGVRTDFRRTSVATIVLVIAGLFSLGFVLFKSYRGTPRGLWAASILLSVLCSTGIAFVWWMQVDDEFQQPAEDILVLNELVAGKVYLRYADGLENDPEVVPTGVFVQSLEFTSANNITMTGYLWQRHARTDGDCERFETKPGFVFPESQTAETELAYCRHEGDETIAGWYFNEVLRQSFDYARYPFDHEFVWIRIWHNQIGGGVVLVPDLPAYDSTAPSDKPGLDKLDFIVEGWEVVNSFFSYRNVGYTTNFGLPGFQGRRDFPELYFNIGLRRDFLNPMIQVILPFILMAFLMFATLLTIRASGDDKEDLGFSTSTVLGFCAAVFFVVVISHGDLRDRLAAKGIIYFEWFYFILYLTILGVSLNAVLIATPLRDSHLHYRDNLPARLLYWPLICGALFVATAWNFL
jgi:hypothetical protein